MNRLKGYSETQQQNSSLAEQTIRALGTLCGPGPLVENLDTTKGRSFEGLDCK
jgi:hypothetical protein